MSRARAGRWMTEAAPRALALLGWASLLTAGAMGCTSERKLRYPVGISGGPVEEAPIRPSTAKASAPAGEDDEQADSGDGHEGHEDGDRLADDRSEHQPVRGFEIPFRSVRRGAMGWSAPPSDGETGGDRGSEGPDSGPTQDSVPVPAVSGSSDDE